jgi:hypothetical protein
LVASRNSRAYYARLRWLKCAARRIEDQRFQGFFDLTTDYLWSGQHTVTTAVIGFAFTLHRPAVAGLALLPVIAFGVADAQYLRVERRFREVFNLVRKESWDTMPSFEINLQSAPAQSFMSAATSWSIVWFYTPLAVGVLLAIFGAWVYG